MFARPQREVKAAARRVVTSPIAVKSVIITSAGRGWISKCAQIAPSGRRVLREPGEEIEVRDRRAEQIDRSDAVAGTAVEVGVGSVAGRSVK